MAKQDKRIGEALSLAERETDGFRMAIGGQRLESASGERFETKNPSFDEVLTEVPFGTAEDIDQAVDTAKRAFPAWRKLDMNERAEALVSLAEAVESRAEIFGMLDAIDCGNPYPAMVKDALKGASNLRFFAGLGMEVKGETIPTPGGGLNYTRREPFGVVGRILPFNHPISFAAGKIAAPLIAGNTVVLKPAEQTPLSALLLGRLAQEILPPGVLNVVTGDGPTCGAALVAHPDVRRIAFTGGVETGRIIMQQAGIKSVTLELGGKNPLVIYPDVNVEAAADAAVAGMNFVRSQGQSCGSNSRVFIHEDLHDAFVDAVLERVGRIRVGLAHLENADMGPVISRDAYNRIFGYIESGQKEGAALIAGGNHPEDPELAAGYFVAPTVFDGVRHGMKIEQEEIFGPVMSILRWSDPEILLEEVNDVGYGLCANIWTNDISTALQFADDVEAGYIWINGHGGQRFRGAPFGGYKDSGLGREHSLEEILSYTQEKNINVRY